MSDSTYVLMALLNATLASVHIGTNWDLYHVLWSIMSGRLLATRGAIIPALYDFGLNAREANRAERALVTTSWSLNEMVADYHATVKAQGHWQPIRHEGYRAVAIDLTGFFRPHLKGCTSKHYNASAGKALPSTTFALVVEAGAIGSMSMGLPRTIAVRSSDDRREADFQRRAVQQAVRALEPDEVLVGDRGFTLKEMLECQAPRSVTRVDKNFTARRNEPPRQLSRGRNKEYGEIVRPLERIYAGRRIEATPPDETAEWVEGTSPIQAHIWNNLTLSTSKQGGPSFQCIAVFDHRYKHPLVLAAHGLTVTAQTVRQLYRDRWQVEKVPLAAKQMLGAGRLYVSHPESCNRLPGLALLAGSLMAYVAAISPATPTGFWDRAANPTCGRLRRTLARLHFSKLPSPPAQFREKHSITDHLPKGFNGLRGKKASQAGSESNQPVI